MKERFFFSIAFITTVYTGGTKEYINRCIDRWKNEKIRFVVIHVDHQLITYQVYEYGESKKKHSFFGMTSKLFQAMIKIHDIRLIHFQHILNLNKEIYNIFMKFKLPYYITLHDYLAICPNINLLKNNVYCEEDGINLCDGCLKQKRINDNCYSSLSIMGWRKWWHEFFIDAKKIIVPHVDVKHRMEKYYRGIEFTVINNPERIYFSNNKSIKRTLQNDKLKVGLIGSMTDVKGAELLIKCANKCTNIEFVLFGEFLDQYSCIELENVIVIGKYNDDNIVSLIMSYKIDFFWFPSPCPETYCYALSIPMQLGFPIISPDLGAIGSRVKSYPRGSVYEHRSDINSICNIIRTFDYERYWQCKINKDMVKSFLSFNNYYSIKSYNDVKKINLSKIYATKEPIYIQKINRREFIYLIKKGGGQWCVYLLLRLDKSLVKDKISVTIKKYIRKYIFA